MEAITIYPKSKEQMRAFEQMAKALRIPFEMANSESPYNSEFMEMVKQADENFKKGKGKTMTPDKIKV